MFNLPISEINFDTVREFCQLKRKEDLDLDYKSDWPADLDRVICAMANVQGGMILIGVNEIPGTREPNWPPLGVQGTQDKLHQRALQIAYDAIYPPVIPEIAVCPLDTDPTRAIVIIRIEASRLLHATDRRRRVYVRVADQGRGYELADISTLEWLHQQREKSIELRNFILERASKRVTFLWAKTASKLALNAYAIPLFPAQVSEIDPSDLLKLASALPPADGLGRSDRTLIPLHPRWRTVSGGVVTTTYPELSFNEYLELGASGLVYLEQQLRTYSLQDSDTGTQRECVNGPAILSFCKAFLNFCSNFYSKIAWHGPILIQANLKHCQDALLDHRISGLSYDPTVNPIYSCPDESLVLHKGEYSARDLGQLNDAIIGEMLFSMMWAYAFSDSRDQLRSYLEKLKR
jgi:hypothetical protein